ncbi:uncharacterized protein LOC135461380 [Liolophura sinensis]|uniref:uncharacterized protein LOC135461380 n=1 Tax=Liolophura sinensis TaxID=3198878 RepID=UPI0031594592
MKCPIASSPWLAICSVHLMLMRETLARAVIETESADSKSQSVESPRLGVEIALYVGLASLVVILAGLLLYCITCIQGTKKRHKPVRRYNKPATIIIKPARMKSHHQQTRVMRPVEPVHPAVLDEYETHSLTMYIPPED